MMRKWLSSGRRDGLVNNDMVNKGFTLNAKYGWWFNDTLKVAVSYGDSTKYPLAAIPTCPFKYKIRSITFYSSIKLNPDILDTVYLKHYES